MTYVNRGEETCVNALKLVGGLASANALVSSGRSDGAIRQLSAEGDATLPPSTDDLIALIRGA